MNTLITSKNRLAYLDAVRAFALILGIGFHASLSFMPIFIGWAVMDISTSHVVSVFALVSHSFRMELFFLIAGFFSHMKYHQQGVQSFLSSRLVKIALPLIVGWFVLRPLIVSGWTMGAESLRGDVNIVNGLLAGLASFGELPYGFLTGTHLWFLYYLLIISLSVVLLRYVIGFSSSLNRTLATWGENIVGWLCRTPIGMLVLIIPTALCLWFMENWGMDTPDKSLMPNMPIAILYTVFFLFGWLLHRQENFIKNFAQITWLKLLACVLSIAATILLIDFEPQIEHPYYLHLKVSFMLSYALMMWSLVALSIGVCERLFTRSDALLRYVADSSYWLYLIHLPIVVWLQVAFAELPLHWLIKLTSISVITLLISIVLYDLFVRSTWLGAILNGKRKSRALPTIASNIF